VNENIPNSNGEFDEKNKIKNKIFINSATHAPLPNPRKIM
jgi:hypothetical protein